MKEDKLLQDIYLLKKGEIGPRIFIKRNCYDYFIDQIFKINFKNLNSENSTTFDFISCGTSIYQDINTFHDSLRIQHEVPIDHFLIYHIAEKMKSQFNNNQNLCVLSIEFIAKLIMDEISSAVSTTPVQVYIVSDGVVIETNHTVSQIINDYIYKKHIHHKDLVTLSGIPEQELADIRSGTVPITSDILFIIAYALTLSSNEFKKLHHMLPENQKPDLSDYFHKILIHELDEISLKRKFPELSKLNAVEYINWLKFYYRKEEEKNES